MRRQIRMNLHGMSAVFGLCRLIMVFGVVAFASFVPCIYASGTSSEIGLMDPSKNMVVWTWVTFGLLLIILYKVAWNPILSALDKREQDIRDSVEAARRIKDELVKIEATRESLINEADTKAKEIVAAARKGAVEASKVIESRAKEEAKILLDNALSDIKSAQEKAEAVLRKESADLAIALAGKLINENLDDSKNRALTDRLIKEM